MMRTGALVVIDIRGQDSAQMALVEDHDVIDTLAANRTDHRSTHAFCQGDRGAVITSVMPIASTRLQKYEPYDPSRSRSRYRGAVSHGNASVTWRESQAAVGCSVTPVLTIVLRSCARMIIT